MKHYGKLPARPGSIKLFASTYLDAGALPKTPATFGHFGGRVGLPWQMFANDRVGDCVWAGAAHETMIWTLEGSGEPAPFDDVRVLADYSAVTGYDPANPDSDQGTDLQKALSYRRTTGIEDANGDRHKLAAYLNIAPGDVDRLAAAAYLFGAAGVGLRMPSYARHQFLEGVPWDVLPIHPTNFVGGHYVPVVGRNSKGNFLVVTWGRLHAMTPDFFAEFSDEAALLLSEEVLRDGKSPEGLDLAELRADLAAITGGNNGEH